MNLSDSPSSSCSFMNSSSPYWDPCWKYAKLLIPSVFLMDWAPKWKPKYIGVGNRDPGRVSNKYKNSPLQEYDSGDCGTALAHPPQRLTHGVNFPERLRITGVINAPTYYFP